MNFIARLFDSEGFMPHGMCLLWRPEIFWMHAASDTVVALSYYSIPLALLYFVHRRRDLAFPWIFLMFGAFILACGTTHVMGLWTLWYPDYVLDGFVKLATALLSITTAVILWPLMPKVLALPSPLQLEEANRELRRAIAIRQQAEGVVRVLNGELEGRVEERTRELARRELLYRSVIETSLDALLLLDEKGIIVEWNAESERMFGWSAQEVIGRDGFEIIFPEAQRAMYRDGFARFLATDEIMTKNSRMRITAMRRDGREFPAELTGVLIRIEDGWTYSVFIRDLSERERAEAQLRQAQKMEAVGQLTGGLAHDFNNLLTVVISNLEEISTTPGADRETRQLAEQALAAGLRGAELTKQLLAFSRRQSLEADWIDINDIVSSTTSLLRRTLGERIKIEQHLAGDLREAFADRAQVGTALANLAINARDAMPDGGTLMIETANKHLDERYVAENVEVTPGDYVMLAVSDTGHGIPPEILQRVFEPFFTTKPEGRGSGLGLSMIYGFAKQSGGHVKIYSEVGHGTTVRLYLPRAKGEAPAEAEAAAPVDQPVAAEGATILVVEDNPDVRKVVVRQLASLGYNPVLANDASAALAILRGERPVDLLFTDVVMPDISGHDLALAAREIRPDLPVLFTSGFSESFGQNGLTRIGQLLSKPYRVRDLAQMIHAALTGAEP